MDNLYDKLAKQYDFWMNNAINISNLNVLGPKKSFAGTFKTLFRNLSNDTVMQKLLFYEMSVVNDTTKRTAETRDSMNLNLISNSNSTGLLSGVPLMSGNIDKARRFARFIQIYMEEEELSVMSKFEKDLLQQLLNFSSAK